MYLCWCRGGAPSGEKMVQGGPSSPAVKGEVDARGSANEQGRKIGVVWLGGAQRDF